MPRTVLQGGSQAPRVSGATWGTLGHGTVVEAGEGDARGGGEGVPRVKTAKNSGLGLEAQHDAVALCRRGHSNMTIRGPALTSCLDLLPWTFCKSYRCIRYNKAGSKAEKVR